MIKNLGRSAVYQLVRVSGQLEIDSSVGACWDFRHIDHLSVVGMAAHRLYSTFQDQSHVKKLQDEMFQLQLRYPKAVKSCNLESSKNFVIL